MIDWIKQLNNLPIARKLVLFYLAAVFISLLLAFVAIVQFDRFNYRQVLEDEISILAAVLSNRTSAAIVFEDQELAQNNLSPLVYRESVVYGCIYKKEDQDQVSVLAEYGDQLHNCPQLTPAKTLIYQDEHNEYLEFINPVLLDGNIIGFLYLKSSLQAFEQRLQENGRIFATVMILAATLGVLIAHYFARSISRPLSALRRTARSISTHEDYSLRAEKFNNDEIGQLVDSFNRMLTIIQDEDAKIRENEEKFRLISSSSKVGIFQLDQNGRFIYANEELVIITGLNKQQLEQGGLFAAIHTDDVRAIQAMWQDRLRKREAMSLNCRLSGEPPRWINGHISPLYRDDNELAGYIGTINDITEVKNAQFQLEKMAFYDTLTGLANRRLFRNRLEHVLHNIEREQQSVGLLLLDLDHFKNINDSMGHDCGDALLVIVAERLLECVRTSDTVARLGGDEFAIILPQISSSRAVSTVADKILQNLSRPIAIRETDIRISTSIGLALAPDDSNGAEELVKHADLALYRAKAQGRNNYQFFTREMNTQLVEHLEMVRDLRLAMEAEQFTLVFQPQINIADNSLVGFEALIRWHCEQRGQVSPMDFIPVAEETGMIIDIGRWVIDSACATLRQLSDQQLVGENAVMTVNLSVKQFQDEGLVGYIGNCLQRHQLQPSQFEVELTETVLMENLQQALVKLEELKHLGIMISIDDFGTGYSSLGYLKQLPVNIIKVDRSFVADIPEDRDDMEITAAVIAMAHKLNYIVVAEGVETAEQLAFLRQCDCDIAQGYFLSPPLEEQALRQFCSSSKPGPKRIQG